MKHNFSKCIFCQLLFTSSYYRQPFIVLNSEIRFSFMPFLLILNQCKFLNRSSGIIRYDVKNRSSTFIFLTDKVLLALSLLIIDYCQNLRKVFMQLLPPPPPPKVKPANVLKTFPIVAKSICKPSPIDFGECLPYFMSLILC